MSPLLLIVPLLILVFLPLAVFMVSRLGWAALAKHYRHRGPIRAERIGVVTGAVNTTNYKNSLLVKFNREGLYLRTIFVYRLFHPPLFIPWTDIGTAEDQSAVFGLWKSLPVGDPQIATVTIPERCFEQIQATLHL